MQRLIILLGALFFSLSSPAATGTKTQVRLLLAQTEARPGDAVVAGVQLKMPPHTHTYWVNPGESGMPTTIDWTLPEGITAGEIQWPVPEKFEAAGIVTYGYHGEVVLIVPLKLSSGLRAGPQELSAKVSWLECEELCIPGHTDVKATLIVGNESKPSPDATLIEVAQKKLPKNGDALAAAATWENAINTNERPFVLSWNASTKPESADFLPYPSEEFDVAPATEVLPAEANKARLRKNVIKTAPIWPTEIAGVLVQKVSTDKETQAFKIRIPLPAVASAAAATPIPLPPFALLLKNLALAFLGGLILNIMPCVFPVIGLKILGFVQQSKTDPRRVFKLGLIYGLGVTVSLLVMAGLVIVGKLGSWGEQMQSPQFSVLLTLLVTLIALNLFGVFEVNIGGSAMAAASQLASKEGAVGAFFNGIVAVILATPCTAPFLASATGFAFAKDQTAINILLMFLAIGAGLSFPYVLLSWRPEWLKFLPRPGAWMEKFKIAMGFPMLATAMWLFSFTAKRFGSSGPLWVGLFLIAVALAAWIWGEFVQRGSKRKGVAMLASLLLLAASYGYALEKELHWRAPVKHTLAGTIETSPGEIAWQPWSPVAVEKARAEGRPVLVDFTADWCLTCKYNKRVALDAADVQAKLKAINAVALLGDNTDEDPTIVAELKKFDRAGVPLVLVYPRDHNTPPMVLPALLTKSLVLDALDKATR